MSDEITLIVEDQKSQRLSLQENLRNRGIAVISAGDVRTARALIHKHRDKLDLLVLDMRLEDPDFPGKTGADLGIELMETKPDHPPEFLINSAYSDLGYYKLSLDLGSAAYLRKKEIGDKQLICHIRALKLRRALKGADVSEQIRRISTESKDVAEIVTRFCREALQEKFKRTLGAPFVFLLTADHQTQCCVGCDLLPEGFNPVYDMIQAIAFAEVRGMRPLKLETSQLPLEGAPQEQLILSRLDGAAFLPFSLPDGIRLSVGLLRQDPNEFPLAEDTEEMAGVLAQYFKNEVLEPLLSMIIRWRLADARADARRQQMLASTADFCLYVGQELLATLQRGDYSNDPQAQRAFIERLKAQAATLRDNGRVLRALSRDSDQKDETQAESWEAVTMAQFTREVASDLDVSIPSEAFITDGDCVVRATREDLLIIISRLLRWFAERFDGEGAISAHFAESDAWAEIAFEDSSSRLSEPLRERLFFPFSEKETGESLYLVKMLVELKYHGVLSDQTDEVPGESGHRFVIRFPRVATG